MTLISVTRLRVRGFASFRGSSLSRGVGPTGQARLGNRGAQLLAETKRTFWISTAWEDKASMREFMMAPPHRRAMGRLLDWRDEAAVVHWLQESPELPDWREAHRRMVAEGRRSKVRHPSPAQQAFEIPPPTLRGR
jgi:heme-degrading monooxygenase HmoA